MPLIRDKKHGRAKETRFDSGVQPICFSGPRRAWAVFPFKELPSNGPSWSLTLNRSLCYIVRETSFQQHGTA